MAVVSAENPGDQAALSSYDHQEHEKILHIWSSGRIKVWRNIPRFVPELVIMFFYVRFWMTKMWDGGSVLPTTSRPRGWSRSSARCPCGWTTAGIRYSSTWQTLPGSSLHKFPNSFILFNIFFISETGSVLRSRPNLGQLRLKAQKFLFFLFGFSFITDLKMYF